MVSDRKRNGIEDDDTEFQDGSERGEESRSGQDEDIPSEFISSDSDNSEDELKDSVLAEEDNDRKETEALKVEVQERKREHEALYDKYIRLVADFDNYKKRVAKDKADIMAYGNEEIIKELLGVVDNLERAIKHSESSQEVKSISEGIRLVHRQFLSSLEKFGVKAMDVERGDKFDPRYHQAVEQIESEEITGGLIISELLKGYTLKEKLLRPSLVVVSKSEEKNRENASLIENGEYDNADS